LYSYCWDASSEFEQGVQNPDYGKSLREGPQQGPTNVQVAELRIRKIKDGIYHLASLLNRLYKSLGYEEPFAALARHWDDLDASPTL